MYAVSGMIQGFSPVVVEEELGRWRGGDSQRLAFRRDVAAASRQPTVLRPTGSFSRSTQYKQRACGL